MPYPFGEDFFELHVNGRKVGKAQCGDFYVFVKEDMAPEI